MSVQFDAAPVSAPGVPVFGIYWEMTHDRSGEVVGSGFSRDLRFRLRPQAGYSYRARELLVSPTREEGTPWPR